MKTIEEHKYLKRLIKESLQAIDIRSPKEPLIKLFNNLGYNTRNSPDLVLPNLNGLLSILDDPNATLDPAEAMPQEWSSVNIVFQFSQLELLHQLRLFEFNEVNYKSESSFLFIAIALKGDRYGRADLSRISREINRKFTAPIVCLFLYGDLLTITFVSKRRSKRNSLAQIIEKVFLIKDVNLQQPKRGHIEILYGLSLRVLKTRGSLSNFEEFAKLWSAALDVKILSNRFYKDLRNWKVRALHLIQDSHENYMEQNLKVFVEHAIVIFIVEAIFLWFLREKGLLSNELFEKSEIPRQFFNPRLGSESPNYTAKLMNNILRGGLASPRERRIYHSSSALFGRWGLAKQDALSPETDDARALRDLLGRVPYISEDLSFGLSRVLSRMYGDIPARGVEFHSIILPNQLVLQGVEEDIALESFAISRRKEPALFEILDKYKFTVSENTPIEVEVALDPELLGNIYQKLAPSSQSRASEIVADSIGAFYTPKEIVDVALKKSIAQLLQSHKILNEEKASKFEQYLQKFEGNLPVLEQEKDDILEFLFGVKVLDPACGTGAFLMGYVDLVTELLKSFRNRTSSPFEKKQIIQKCLFGIDTNPVAIYTTKLRFIIYIAIDTDFEHQQANIFDLEIESFGNNFVEANTLEINRCNADYEKLRGNEDAPQSSTSSDNPLWLAGLGLISGKGHFDLICGNPPWGIPAAEERWQLKANYPEVDSKSPNYSAYFLSWSWRQIGAVVAMVVPDVIVTKSFPKIQEVIKANATDIVWVQNSGLPSTKKYFEETDLDFALIVSSPSPSSSLKLQTWRYTSQSDEQQREDFDAARTELSLSFGGITSIKRLDTKYSKIFELIERFPTVDQNFEVHEGVHSGNARKQLFLRPSDSNRNAPTIIVGSKSRDQIFTYYCKPFGWKLNLDIKAGGESNLKFQIGNLEWHSGKKILVQRTGRPLVAFFDQGNFFSNNFLAIIPRMSNSIHDFDLKSMLPFLNSPVTSFYIGKFLAPRIGSSFLETKAKHLKRLRIPVDFPGKDVFIQVSQGISTYKEQGSSMLMLEKLLNALVYEVYFPDEVKRECGSLIELTTNILFRAESANEGGDNFGLVALVSSLDNPSSQLRKSMFQLGLVQEIQLIEQS